MVDLDLKIGLAQNDYKLLKNENETEEELNYRLRDNLKAYSK
jgi:hypothetical protein